MKIRNAYPGKPCPAGHPESGAGGCFADDQPEPALYRCDKCGEVVEADGVTEIDGLDLCAPCQSRVITDPAGEQLDLWDNPCRWSRAFHAWVHTPNGRLVADRFIRIAYGCKARGIRLGSKAIWERLRWNFMLRKQDGEAFKLNNNFTAAMARFAVQREPGLADYFETRKSEGDGYVYKSTKQKVRQGVPGDPQGIRADAGAVGSGHAGIEADG